MKQKITVIFAFAGSGENQSLIARFKASEKVDVVAVVDNGVDLVEKAKRLMPDVIVSGLLLPRKDGLAAFAEMKNMGLSPTFIAVSPFFSENVMSEASRLGVAHLILLPCDENAVFERVLKYSSKSAFPESAKEENLELQVTNMLHEVGVPAHIKGYQYLRVAIMMTVEDLSCINAVTKILYPAVAKKFQTNSSRVERAIRHAIEVAWDRCDVDVLNDHFGYTVSTHKGKPTNSEFISMIADSIRLKRKFG